MKFILSNCKWQSIMACIFKKGKYYRDLNFTGTTQLKSTDDHIDFFHNELEIVNSLNLAKIEQWKV